MRAKCFAVLLASLFFLGADAAPSLDIPGLGRFTVSGPYRHRNLTLYLIHGDDRSGPRPDILTLAEGMKGKQVVVHETGTVNRLSVENRSDRHVFIQAGDIVRGGMQDRIIVTDLLLPPRSGRVPIGTFCVERGRWVRRGDEPVRVFASSSNAAAGSDLKLAARKARSQDRVWDAVATTQGELSESLMVTVSGISPSSMELTLENKAVKKATTRYVKALTGAVDGHDDVVGVVGVINGRMRSANVFGWHGLFMQLWPKTLSALAVEAVGAKGDSGTGAPPSWEEVARLLAAPAGAGETITQVRPGLAEHRLEYDGMVRFVTRHDELGWLRAEVLSERE
jgi:hypothetical protein